MVAKRMFFARYEGSKDMEIKNCLVLRQDLLNYGFRKEENEHYTYQFVEEVKIRISFDLSTPGPEEHEVEVRFEEGTDLEPYRSALGQMYESRGFKLS